MKHTLLQKIEIFFLLPRSKQNNALPVTQVYHKKIKQNETKQNETPYNSDDTVVQ